MLKCNNVTFHWIKFTFIHINSLQPSVTLAHAACPLTWRQSRGGLSHAGRPEAETLLLKPCPPLLLQLLLDLVDLLCQQVIVLSLSKEGNKMRKMWHMGRVFNSCSKLKLIHQSGSYTLGFHPKWHKNCKICGSWARSLTDQVTSYSHKMTGKLFPSFFSE